MIGRRRSRDGERGFVLVISVLLVTTLLLFSGLAIDFGSFYVRAAQIKRAADAAALAGVVWMPEIDTARAAALAAAERNGFKNGVDDVSIEVEEVPDNNRQLKVTVTDGKVNQYFSRLAINRQSITRGSTAEYVLPVPLGSPRNTFGTNTLLPDATNDEYFWAAVNGWCAGHESGDEKLARYESYSGSSGSSACNDGSPQSDNHDPNGYLYAINLPANASSLKLEVYDPAYNTSYPQEQSQRPDRPLASGTQQTTTYFEIYDRNLTPLDLTNLTLIDTDTFTTDQDQANNRNQWVRLYTWNNPQAGQYYMRVRTQENQLNSRTVNGFGIRAYTGSSFSSCTTIIGGSGYSATCPQVHGVYDMSIYANGADTTAEFYLAQIDPVHAGKTMRLTLFDAGEGADTLRVIDPNGVAASFTWFTPCNPPIAASGGCSGAGSSLNVAGSGTQPYTGAPAWTLNSDSKYNDRYLILDIHLDNNYAATYGTNRWWRIRYTAGSNPTDRTTWSVNIVGDPVHLVK